MSTLTINVIESIFSLGHFFILKSQIIAEKWYRVGKFSKVYKNAG